MQPDFIPQTPAQWFGLTIATILAALGGWFTRRKREPVELDKIKAETRQIHTASEVAQANVSLDILRELREITQKAEQRREEGIQREERMRTQTLFWRNKAEELDGRLADAQEMIWKMEKEVATYETQIERMNHTLKDHGLNYDDSKNKPVKAE